MVGDQTVSHLMEGHAVVIWSQYVNGSHLEVIQDGFVDGQGSQETGDLARLLHATQPVLVDPFSVGGSCNLRAGMLLERLTRGKA